MPLSSPLAFARRLKARARATVETRAMLASGTDIVRFECNLCGMQNAVVASALSREIPSCALCHSTVRLRAVAHLVVKEVLGVTQPLTALGARTDIAGIGVSYDDRYAQPLARVFNYQNTHFHTEPRLDITAVPPERAGRYDFVVASDVFEHVLPPVDRAFRGARALLRRGGVLVFTVPFTLAPETVEHFPELHAWRLEETPRGWRLHNVTAKGRAQVFDDLVFHGGPGSTLEMRVFSRAALERAFASAGFARVRLAAEACPRFGVEWPEPFSVPMVAYAG